MIIALPWPDPLLSPNARAHWRPISEAKKKARWDAGFLAVEAMGLRAPDIRARLAGAHPIPITVRFYPPDARHRDDDNMVGSFKAARDGIAQALDVNDRRFRPHYFFEPPVKNGKVEVEFPDGGQIGDKFLREQADCLINGSPPESEEAA